MACRVLESDHVVFDLENHTIGPDMHPGPQRVQYAGQSVSLLCGSSHVLEKILPGVLREPVTANDIAVVDGVQNAASAGPR